MWTYQAYVALQIAEERRREADQLPAGRAGPRRPPGDDAIDPPVGRGRRSLRSAPLPPRRLVASTSASLTTWRSVSGRNGSPPASEPGTSSRS